LYELGGIYDPQELHELGTNLSRGFVLYPVAYIVEFEDPHETGKPSAELVGGRIELLQAIDLSRNEK
jgi:hypothetical protein